MLDRKHFHKELQCSFCFDPEHLGIHLKLRLQICIDGDYHSKDFKSPGASLYHKALLLKLLVISQLNQQSLYTSHLEQEFLTVLKSYQLEFPKIASPRSNH